MISPSFEIKTCQVTIPLPAQTKILVEQGENVVKDEILAEVKESLQEFNLTKILKISAPDIKGCLLVSPGTKVKEGEILVQKKSLLSTSVFKSPVTGVFTELLPEGFLKIKVGEKKEIKSPAKARILQVKNDCLVLEFEAAVLTGEESEGGENWGEIEIVQKEEIDLSDLPPSPSGKIFVIRCKISPGFVHKAEALEAAGIVGGTLEGKIKTMDLVLLAIGGKDGLIPENLWSNLKKYEKRRACISGREKTLKIPLE